MKMLWPPTQESKQSEHVVTAPDADRSVSGNGSRANIAPAPRAASPALDFRKAIKRGAKLRLAVCGPSGSGKTYTLLKLATELGGPVALVDTERGSASKYADIFDFDVIELGSYDPRNLITLIDTAASKGYQVLCIDSLSHFWIGKDGELDQVDRAARRMQTPNSFAAWKQVTPIHNALVDKIISAPLHVLVGLRSKTEWVLERDDKTGKTAPRKVGLAPVMRDGIEYEFDVCGEMDQENTLVITKSRCPKLTGGVFLQPGKELADVLKEWLGGPPTDRSDPETSVVPAALGDSKTGDLNKDPATEGAGGSQPAGLISQELVSIWKRMCSPRGVAKELEELKTAIEKLAGSTGVAEYARVLRQHGVDRPKEFKTAQSARLCAKDVFTLLEELRSNARENDPQLNLGPERQATRSQQPVKTLEAR
jgi:AAA domain-containing protein